MLEFLEMAMILSFGASWPLNVIKSYKARSTKGKSLTFLWLILFGYVAGILSKLLNAGYMAQIGSKWYVLVVYILNFVMVGTDLILYFRNRMIEKNEATLCKTSCLEADAGDKIAEGITQLKDQLG